MITHPYYQICENTWRFSDYKLTSMYLLAGKEKALLIDTGFGIGNLPEECAKLTDLPLTAAITHGHIDHAGGAGFFEKCLVSPIDTEAIRGTVSTAARRKSVPANAARRGLTVPFDVGDNVPDWSYAPEWEPLQDGDTIDLGDRLIRVIAIPGHTRGSMAFLDVQNRLLFSGDACNPNMIMAKPTPAGKQFDPNEENAVAKYAAPLPVLLESLKRLKTFSGEFDLNYIGHLDDFAQKPQTNDVIDDLIGCCEKIIAKGVPADQIPNKPETETFGGVKITYVPSQIPA